MSTTMLALIDALRKTPLYRQLIPSENVGTGWPIPVRRQGKVYVTLPFFGQVHDYRVHQTLLYPPFAVITLDWTNQKLVEYVDLRFRPSWPDPDWETSVGTFPHPAVAGLNKEPYEDLRIKLLAMYDEMMEALTSNTPLSAEWDSAFRALLGRMVEPALEPYYRVLGSKFFSHFLVREAV